MYQPQPNRGNRFFAWIRSSRITRGRNRWIAGVCDGVARRLGDTGRILVRESGTEPLLRVMVEAPDDALCRACVDEVVSVIKQSGHAL